MVCILLYCLKCHAVMLSEHKQEILVLCVTELQILHRSKIRKALPQITI